jgi:hypothetical protein
MTVYHIAKQLLKTTTNRTIRKQIIEDSGLKDIRAERIQRLLDERSKLEKMLRRTRSLKDIHESE